jgi:hypothetical protein
MEEISEIIKDLVTGIDNRVFYDYVVDPPPLSTTHFYNCDTKWMRIGDKITNKDGGFSFVTTLEVDTDFSFFGGTGPWVLDPPNNFFYVRTPFFQSGTKLAANREWTISNTDLTLKTPLVWLFEIIRVQKFGRGDVREFETDLRLFFLDETNVKDFYTEDHRREVVKPMIKLAEEFLNVVRGKANFQTIENYTLVTFSRFGVETDQGVIENILDANLSGVELQFTLTKYKENCKIC